VTVYAIAQLRIHDRAPYERYAAAFMPVLRQYGGRLVVADGAPEIAEGEWDGNRVVVLAFADRDAFNTWANSPEYSDRAGPLGRGTDHHPARARSGLTPTGGVD